MRNVGLFIPDTPVTQLPAPDEMGTGKTTTEISEMTVAQLKAYAEDNEIELGTAKTKADILTIITGVM